MHIYSTNLHKQMLSVNIVQFNWFTPKAGAIESVRRRARTAQHGAMRRGASKRQVVVNVKFPAHPLHQRLLRMHNYIN